MIRMLNTIKLFNRINNLTIKSEGSKTQISADIHEKKVLESFLLSGVSNFTPDGENTKNNSAFFRKWFNKTTGTDSRKDIKGIYPIVSRETDISNYITPETPWIVHQPHGSQNFPDMILFKIEKDFIRTLYIECKSAKPSFNNNPPKKNGDCIYICGNKMYNGYFLRSHDSVSMYLDFLKEYKELIEKYKNIPDYDMVPVFYKKNEFKAFPPPFFKGKEELNFRLNKYLIKNILQ
jgi:hypothetical protein